MPESPIMKKPAIKYVGDKAVRALLRRYVCPFPFHEVRMQFFGTIAAPEIDVSPFNVIEDLWEGELPMFDDEESADEFFQTLISLWNELTRHQSAIRPFRLMRVTTNRDSDGLRRLCQTRLDELECFVDGMFGDEEVIDLPERASKAMDNLYEINEKMHTILHLLDKEEAPPASQEDLASILKSIRGVSRIAEKELHAVMLSCTQMRIQFLSNTTAINQPTIH